MIVIQCHFCNVLVREFVLYMCLFVKCVDCVNVNEIKDLLFTVVRFA